MQASPVTVVADPAECSFQFDPVGKKAFTQSATSRRPRSRARACRTTNEAAPAGRRSPRVRIGDGDGRGASTRSPGTLAKAEFKTAQDDVHARS